MRIVQLFETREYIFILQLERSQQQPSTKNRDYDEMAHIKNEDADFLPETSALVKKEPIEEPVGQKSKRYPSGFTVLEEPSKLDLIQSAASIHRLNEEQTFQTLFILWDPTSASLRTHDQVQKWYEKKNKKAPDPCQKTALQVRDTYERLTNLHTTASSLPKYSALHSTERRCVLEVAAFIQCNECKETEAIEQHKCTRHHSDILWVVLNQITPASSSDEDQLASRLESRDVNEPSQFDLLKNAARAHGATTQWTFDNLKIFCIDSFGKLRTLDEAQKWYQDTQGKRRPRTISSVRQILPTCQKLTNLNTAARSCTEYQNLGLNEKLCVLQIAFIQLRNGMSRDKAILRHHNAYCTTRRHPDKLNRVIDQVFAIANSDVSLNGSMRTSKDHENFCPRSNIPKVQLMAYIGEAERLKQSYVYFLCDEREFTRLPGGQLSTPGVVLYIGKGTGRRSESHIYDPKSSRRETFDTALRREGIRIIETARIMSDATAFDLEAAMISLLVPNDSRATQIRGRTCGLTRFFDEERLNTLYEEIWEHCKTRDMDIWKRVESDWKPESEDSDGWVELTRGKHQRGLAKRTAMGTSPKQEPLPKLEN